MNFCKRSYQPILRYLYTEVTKRRGEISLHKHFNQIALQSWGQGRMNQHNSNMVCTDLVNQPFSRRHYWVLPFLNLRLLTRNMGTSKYGTSNIVKMN